MRGKRAKLFRKRAYGVYAAEWEDIRNAEKMALFDQTIHGGQRAHADNTSRSYYLKNKKAYKEYVSHQ